MNEVQIPLTFGPAWALDQLTATGALGRTRNEVAGALLHAALAGYTDGERPRRRAIRLLIDRCATACALAARAGEPGNWDGLAAQLEQMARGLEAPATATTPATTATPAPRPRPPHRDSRPPVTTTERSKFAALRDDGVSLKQIAERTGRSIGTVKRHLQAMPATTATPAPDPVSVAYEEAQEWAGANPTPRPAPTAPEPQPERPAPARTSPRREEPKPRQPPKIRRDPFVSRPKVTPPDPTDTVAAFIARGGKITKCPGAGDPALRNRQRSEESE